MSKPMSVDDRRRLRDLHTCVRDASSMRCVACNAGTPFPPLVAEGASFDELLDAMFPPAR